MAATTRELVTESPHIAELAAVEVYRAVGTRPSGLSNGEAAARLAASGPNTLARPRRRPLFFRLSAHFAHVMAILLWIGGFVALAAGLPQLAVAIWIVNFVNGLFSFWQEYRAEKATEALRRLLPVFATVLREGVAVRVDAEDLVPGDVMLLEEGDRISADGRLVDHVSLRVDQSTLTGESHPVRKASEPYNSVGRGTVELPNMVFAGTTVAAGRGKVVVTATGETTEFGRLASLTQGVEEVASPLQIEMRRLSYMVSVVAVGVGIVVFALALSLAGFSLPRGFIFALGMIVAFVPEGLLPTVTLALAMGTQRMARRNALVKKLSAVETLGSTSVICTDKTGTLTENELTVRWVMAGDRQFEFSGVGYAPEGRIVPAPDDPVRDLLRVAVLASNARLVPPDPDHARWTVVGDPTEGAVLTAAAKLGLHQEAETARSPRLFEFPFDSVRKRMSTVNRVEEGVVLHTKGAPLELLDRCRPLPNRRQVVSAIEARARDGLRVLGVARKKLEAIPGAEDPNDAERDLEFLGLLAMHDPPRPEVAAAVATCRKAGIRIVMITGDYAVTAETIGRRIGMVGPEPVRVITGEDLEKMEGPSLRRALEEEDVLFARVNPEHKLRVVSVLQEMGHVVAVTGDGVNDAPALKKADIGVAMGVAGTDVAKEAADMVLLDDNFASIVAAVEEGRAVYANIKKFTTYILTSNTPEAVPFIAFAFSGGRIPLALDVMHILAIDLGTDLAPALALGAEPPEPGIMDRPPRRPGEHVVDRRLLTRAYLWLGPFQAAFVMAAFFGAYRLAGWTGFLDLPSDETLRLSASGMALAAVAATQIGNLFTQRSERLPLYLVGLKGNKLLWWGIASEVVLIAVFVYVPLFQRVIGTAPFPAVGWLWLLAGIPVLPLADQLRRWLTIRNRPDGRE